MATGGLKNAVCKLTATKAPNQISMSILDMPSCSFSTTGRKIGRNTSTMAGHSNGQPSTNIKNMITTSFQTSGSGIPTKVSVITLAVPSLVKTAPNTLEETASNSTMLDVTMVAMAAFLTAVKLSRR